MTPYPPRPSVEFIISQANGRPSEMYARFFLQLLLALDERDALLAEQAQTITDQADHIEILRVALNEVRQNPTTTYPIIPAF